MKIEAANIRELDYRPTVVGGTIVHIPWAMPDIRQQTLVWPGGRPP